MLGPGLLEEGRKLLTIIQPALDKLKLKMYVGKHNMCEHIVYVHIK